MSNSGLPKNEFYLKCPLYAKGLEVCPSSKDRLLPTDVSLLTTHCITDHYKTCSFFSGQKEAEQAA
ncbi:hypothetical protein EHS15_18165 [Leptospira idonii]|uniref:Uncharacterized protein n=1 Tax=Leptospira idonii TaxID=1193500 RepID=A0A4R9LVE0_9LEPT|nr:hypothetical protein EHS15_18165 [Leptospira idonii]